MSPLTCRPGKARISSINSTSSSGRAPPLFSSRPMFTSTSASIIRPSLSQSRDISRASFTLPTDWIQLTLPIRYLTLLVCSWPINCRSHPSLSRRSYLSRSSCTRFSPRHLSPLAMAWFITSTGTVFVAASRVMSPGLLPERSAARAIFSSISW